MIATIKSNALDESVNKTPKATPHLQTSSTSQALPKCIIACCNIFQSHIALRKSLQKN